MRQATDREEWRPTCGRSWSHDIQWRQLAEATGIVTLTSLVIGAPNCLLDGRPCFYVICCDLRPASALSDDDDGHEHRHDGPDEKMPKQQPQSDCRTYLFAVAVDPSFRSDVTRLCVSLSHANLPLGPDVSLAAAGSGCSDIRAETGAGQQTHKITVMIQKRFSQLPASCSRSCSSKLLFKQHGLIVCAVWHQPSLLASIFFLFDFKLRRPLSVALIAD